MGGVLKKIYNLIIILRIYYWYSFIACVYFYIFRSGVSYQHSNIDLIKAGQRGVMTFLKSRRTSWQVQKN